LKNLKLISLFALILSIVFSGCTKETQSSQGNPSPVITLEKTTPTNVLQFKDSLTVTIGYEDGDGDLGYENADINSLEIRDTRLSKPDYYYVPPQAPIGSSVHIKGTLNIQIKNLFLLGTGNTETTNLEIKIQDSAGHWSNLVTSPTITINS
jgi:hypothetical protein